ncbi:hypothetical protein RchiOBHm_Chr5g0042021 [Rosa chinensis]|uniref:Transmembrane protein n=1 Tax=Rosa chinensis TaxID=74649 RepID=A0A2P6QD11_ROSCH|nr:hypothetical protein RchiOBHm_Chr5g0042021 [Rosa chinensis]
MVPQFMEPPLDIIKCWALSYEGAERGSGWWLLGGIDVVWLYGAAVGLTAMLPWIGGRSEMGGGRIGWLGPVGIGGRSCLVLISGVRMCGAGVVEWVASLGRWFDGGDGSQMVEVRHRWRSGEYGGVLVQVPFWTGLKRWGLAALALWAWACYLLIVGGFWLGFFRFGFCLGIISPSSIKRGLVCFGFIGVSWSGLLSVLFGYQRDGESPLYVVWQFWIAVSERVETVHRNVGDWVVSVYVRWLLIVARGYERKIWLGVEPFWLMEVTHVDDHDELN